jgi:amino acid adenylation domain-containing protein
VTPWQQLAALRNSDPGRAIFADADVSLTANAFHDRVLALAGHLHTLGIGPGDNVAVYLPRGVQAAAAIHGVLAAGACYVPLDTGNPAQRSVHIVTDAQCRAVITGADAPAWLAGTGAQAIAIDPYPAGAVTGPLPDNAPGDNAAILYTSGSTGTPKGVVLSHRAIAAFCEWAADTFKLCDGDRVASLAPFHFDLSLFDLFAAPAAGALTRFVPDALKLSPARLVDWLHEQAITTWYTVPSILVFITLRGGLQDKPLPELRRILFAGEVFPPARLLQLAGLLPHTAFYNLFGPTETNVCLYWPVDRSRLRADEPVPVGLAACQAQTRVDPEHEELLVRGPCLMSGYWRDGRPELDTDAGGWFHTGDRVSVNARGEYEYHGRLDRMIKSAGYRVEPAEIEQVLGNAPGVTSVAVVGIPDPLSGTRIAAAVSADTPDRRALQGYAGKTLAPYMRPYFYLFVPDMPCLPNGKKDYRQITRLIEQALP